MNQVVRQTDDIIDDLRRFTPDEQLLVNGGVNPRLLMPGDIGIRTKSIAESNNLSDRTTWDIHQWLVHQFTPSFRQYWNSVTYDCLNDRSFCGTVGVDYNRLTNQDSARMDNFVLIFFENYQTEKK